MSQDERAYYTFYGIDINTWEENFGTLLEHNKLLVKQYLSEDASTTSSTQWTSSGTVFLYPHHIKKKYYIEGVVEGQITFTADPYGNDPDGTGASYVSDFRVTLIKYGNDASEEEFASTGVINISDYDDYKIDGNGYKVYPFWIDVYTEPIEFTENERFGIKIDWDIDNSSTPSCYLSHENWQQGEDIKITIPLLL